MNITYSDVDSAVEEAIASFKRMTRLSIKSFSLSDLNFLDRGLVHQIQSRLEHVIEVCSDKQALLADVKKHTAYPNVTYKFMSHYVEHGVRPKYAKFNLPSQKTMASEYRVLTPYILTNMQPDTYLIGFSSGDAAIWFAGVSETGSGFDCVGYSGEIKNIAFSVIEDMGYTRVNGSAKDIRFACKNSIESTVDATSVKEVGFYLRKKTVPSADQRVAIEKLTDILESITCVPDYKPREAVRIR
jgi:hypothetical protein